MIRGRPLNPWGAVLFQVEREFYPANRQSTRSGSGARTKKPVSAGTAETGFPFFNLVVLFKRSLA